MNKFSKAVIPAMFFAFGLTAAAQAQTAQQAAESTVSQKSAQLVCEQNRKVKVRYGFNKEGVPTFAEIKSDGKTRFMPINLARSDANGTFFGDENNFNLSTTSIMSSKNYKKQKGIMIMSPDSEIIYKGCKTR